MKPDFSKEPTGEELAALVAGELDEARAEEVRDALAHDPELARAALDAADPERMEKLAGLSRDHVEAAWRAFQGRLGEDVGPAEPRAPAPTPLPVLDRRAPWSRFVAAYPIGSLAAALLVGLFVGASLYRGLRMGDGVNVVVERLETIDTIGVPRGRERALVADRRVETLVLLLSPPSSIAGEIPPRVRSLVWRGAELRMTTELAQQDEGNFALVIDAKSMPPGEYRIQLIRPGEKAPFAEYELVRASAPGR